MQNPKACFSTISFFFLSQNLNIEFVIQYYGEFFNLIGRRKVSVQFSITSALTVVYCKAFVSLHYFCMTCIMDDLHGILLCTKEKQKHSFKKSFFMLVIMKPFFCFTIIYFPAQESLQERTAFYFHLSNTVCFFVCASLL